MPTDLLTSDAAARSEALDVSRSFLVQAPAGSGKTELLIQRYLALLARVEEPEAVVAITFTRKAAGEMRNRVLKALDEAAANVPVAEEHAKITRRLAAAVLDHDHACGWNLRQMPARLRIQTIDSLCSSIAQSMPAVCGFGGLPEIAESADDLYAAAAHQTVLLLGSDLPSDSEAVATLLRHLDNDVSSVERLIAVMLKQRDQWMRPLGQGADLSTVRRNLDTTLERIVCRSLNQLCALVAPSAGEEIIELARFAAAQPVNASRPMRNCEHLNQLPGCAAADVDAWLGIADLLLTSGGEWRKPGGINKRIGFDAMFPERARLRELLESLSDNDTVLAALCELRELPPARIDDRQWPVIAALFRLLPVSVGELKLVFASRRQVDFVEVAQAASLALGTREAPTDLALALGYRIEHLLVDEYQDTSVSQQELLEKLTATWDPGDGRTLFLVGDPMQSIYRFRQAEVGLFIEAAQAGQIGDVPLEPLVLKANFRSQQGIVDWVNETFAQVFPWADDIGKSAVCYSPSESVKPPEPSAAVEIHPLIGQNWAEQETECVLRLIESAHARDPKATVAVLVRARTHLLKLVPKLRERGLRFRAVDIDSLAERQAVLDLVSLTRALLDRADRIAWLSVLRAPWCGLTLQDLYTLCHGDRGETCSEGAAHLPEVGSCGPLSDENGASQPIRTKATDSCIWDLLLARASQLSSDGQQRVERLREVIEQAFANREREPLAHLVRGIWLALGGPACVSESDMEDVASFFELLEEMEADGESPSAQQLTKRLASLFAHPDAQADDTLQLMTIHKAKGLEFDAVIVPGLGRRPRGDDAKLLLWLERVSPQGDPELLLAPIKRRGGEDDPLYRFIRRVEHERGCEEERRLLYVAATRARRKLHLLGHANVDTKGDVKPDAASLLHYLWPVVSGVFVQAQIAMRDHPPAIDLAASGDVNPPRLRKRLPADWSAPKCPEPIQGAPAATSPGAEVTFDWASDTARHIGTVIHAFLHKIARDGIERSDRMNAQAIRASLSECGVAPSELEEATARVQTALQQTLQDERGRWILGAHCKAQSEYAITGVLDGEIRHFQVDRTFVDESGVRWIIDYKTGFREGGSREQFADAEVERYRKQLEDYARVLTVLDPGPVRIGLYFPLLGAWREWTLD